MEESYEQNFQYVLSAIKQVGTGKYANACDEVKSYIPILAPRSLLIDGVNSIVNAITEAGIKFDEDLLEGLLGRCQLHSLNKDCVKNIFNIMEDNIIFNNSILGYLLSTCRGRSLDADCVKMVLEKKPKWFTFGENSLPEFLNILGENSLDEEDLEKIYHSCAGYSFENFYYKKEEINSKLNKVSQKFFQSLCEFHEREKEEREREERERERERKRKRLEKLVENYKQGIFGGIGGVIFGGFIGLGAIAFVVSWAIGLIALSVTTVAAIAAPIAAVSLALLCFFSYWIDKCIENKTLIEIKEGKREKIRKDLLHRKKIKDALNNSKEPLLQNEQERQL